MFWVENFESGSTAGEQVNSYVGLNGAWTLTVNADPSYSPEATSPNLWYVSCAENGHTAGVCGTGCAAVSATATLASLHIGSNPAVFGDIGASYDAGGTCGSTTSTFTSITSISGVCVTTNRRAESPTIDCSGKSNILLKFYYIENGDGANDDGSVWWYDGTSWSLLTNTPKTPTGCAPQGQWTMDTITLPAAANNNPNVKIGFSWVNNDDAVGTDPSFAVDSVSLSVVAPAPVASFVASISTACQDSCITFTSTSTGSIDSVRWVMPGVTISTPNANPLVLCNYPSGGVDTMHLYVYGPGGVNIATTTITINALPQVTIAQTGDLLSVSGGYPGYQWGKGLPPVAISGATNNTYTISTSGIYGVEVDSAGCWGFDTISVVAVGVNPLTASGNKFWLVPSGNNSITLHATNAIKYDVTVDIFDISGKQLLEDTWRTGSDVKEINDVIVPPGSYLIKLNSANTSEVLKWTKQ